MLGKFCILSLHRTAMHKGQALESVSRRAHLLSPNQMSKLIKDSDSDETQCDVANMEDGEY
jgi:hypothetical protein